MLYFKEKKIALKFLISFSLVGFFIVVFLRASAQTTGGNESSCRMTVLSMEANPTSIDTKTSVNFHAKVDRKGCAQNLDINFEFYTMPDGYPRMAKSCTDKSPHQDIIEFDCPYDFSQYQYWSSITLPGTLSYYMAVFSSQRHSYASTSSWGKKFTVAKGILGENFSFIVEPGSPVMGETLTVKYVDFPPGATGKIFVNDDNHFVNIFSGGNLIAVNTQNGFKLGSNNSVRIVLYNSGGVKFYDTPYTFTTVQTGASVAGGGTFGCKAKDNSGIWACYDTVQKAMTAGCVASVKKVDSAWCGKTDAQIAAPGASAKPADPAAATADKAVSGGTDCIGANFDPSKCLYNPLPEDDLTRVFLMVVQGFLGIVGIWAVMFIIIGGFRMVMAAGNEEQYLAAKKTIIWAVLGAVVAIMSFSIIAVVQNLLQANPAEIGKVIK